MKLQIKNFGPIEEGEIDLSKKIYIFVGYNNTGKTYLSQLMYAILGQDYETELSKSISFEELGIEIIDNKIELSQSIIDKFCEKLSIFLVEKIIPDTFNISKNHHLIKDANFKFLPPSLEEIKEIETIHSIGFAEIIEKKDSNFSNIELWHGVTEKEKGKNYIDIDKDFFNNLDNIYVYSSKGGNDIKTNVNTKNYWLSSLLLGVFWGEATRNMFLSASRIFYPIFYQYIFKVEKEKREIMSKHFSRLIENIEKNETNKEDILGLLKAEQKAQKSRYTKPTNELIDKFYDLHKNDEQNSIYKKQVEALEQLFGGKITMEDVGSIANKEFGIALENEKELDMYLASSSTNQLTALHLYFKYWAAEKHNFLVIDEAEENLHPKYQLEVFKILLEFASMNENKLLLVTHTPLIVESLNNYLMLGTLKKVASDETYQKTLQDLKLLDIPLTAKEVGIYFFSGSEIREYEIGEYGTVFKDFDREIYKVKNASETLSSTIFKSKKK